MIWLLIRKGNEEIIGSLFTTPILLHLTLHTCTVLVITLKVYIDLIRIVIVFCHSTSFMTNCKSSIITPILFLMESHKHKTIVWIYTYIPCLTFCLLFCKYALNHCNTVPQKPSLASFVNNNNLLTESKAHGKSKNTAITFSCL